LEPVALAVVAVVVRVQLMAAILYLALLLLLAVDTAQELVTAASWLEALAALAVVVVAILLPSPLAAQETLQ
jgi:hypothetical protein